MRILTCKKRVNNGLLFLNTVKIHQNGQPLPFPDKMDALWRLALGLPSLQ